MKNKNILLALIILGISIFLSLTPYSAKADVNTNIEEFDESYKMLPAPSGNCCICMWYPYNACDVGAQCCNWFKDYCYLGVCGL